MSDSMSDGMSGKARCSFEPNGAEPGGSEVDWLAFQYCAGELSDDAARRFELRLETDQAAREAVAAAVELTVAITAGQPAPCPPPAPTPRAAWLQPVSWLTVATAACLTVALVYSVSRSDFSLVDADRAAARQPRASQPHRAAAEITEALAHSWVATGEFLQAERPQPGDVLADLLLEDLAAEYVPADPLQAPAWMLAGLAELSDAEMQE